MNMNGALRELDNAEQCLPSDNGLNEFVRAVRAAATQTEVDALTREFSDALLGVAEAIGACRDALSEEI